uniref:MalT-like TPR region domain-containing protein n=1 Tax=Cyclophora tenuis TaxID=216820 RepID=A0A7S1DCF9_CYCTE|mmetsp:Transcript_6220/g.10813  ORF Transcript_6220/g.10813 Transcript_6220/m.10813 type:complete len:202 (+) Transcript_6220:290-895(+)
MESTVPTGDSCSTSSSNHTSSSTSVSNNNNNSKGIVVTQQVHSRIRQLEDELQKTSTEFGADNIELVRTLGMLGLLHQHMTRDLSKARDCHQEASRILQKYLQDDKVEGERGGGGDLEETLAVTLTDLGSCHEKLGEYELANQEYSKAWALLVSIDSCDQKLMLLEACSRGMSRTCRTTLPQQQQAPPPPPTACFHNNPSA